MIEIARKTTVTNRSFKFESRSIITYYCQMNM